MSLDTIRDYISYDPETGVFRWIKKPNRRGRPFRVGDEAGHTRKSDGRRVICFAGKLYLASRLAWFFVHGEFPQFEVDHENTSPGDNRFANLRPADRQSNMLNTRSHVDAVGSPFKGVCLHRKTGKWAARFRNKHLGLFVSEADAARAYDAAALAFNPAFARVNFPEGGALCRES